LCIGFIGECSGVFSRVLRHLAVDEPPPAAALERSPFTFGLSEAIGDHVERQRVGAKARVAAADMDVLGGRRPSGSQAIFGCTKPSVLLQMTDSGTSSGALAISIQRCKSCSGGSGESMKRRMIGHTIVERDHRKACSVITWRTRSG